MRKINAGNKVEVRRDIFRIESITPYAESGEQGEVVEVFKGDNTRQGNHAENWFAKVRMTTDEIKTFRLTSLERLS